MEISGKSLGEVSVCRLRRLFRFSPPAPPGRLAESSPLCLAVRKPPERGEDRPMPRRPVASSCERLESAIHTLVQKGTIVPGIPSGERCRRHLQEHMPFRQDRPPSQASAGASPLRLIDQLLRSFWRKPARLITHEVPTCEQTLASRQQGRCLRSENRSMSSHQIATKLEQRPSLRRFRCQAALARVVNHSWAELV